MSAIKKIICGEGNVYKSLQNNKLNYPTSYDAKKSIRKLLNCRGVYENATFVNVKLNYLNFLHAMCNLKTSDKQNSLNFHESIKVYILESDNQN